MAKGRLTKTLRRKLATAAQHRCGYCQTSELITAAQLEVDHLLPESRGGLTVEENLWMACRQCNASKKDRVAATDPETGQTVRLFHPRSDRWADHFRWADGGAIIEGITPAGRATVLLLDLNRTMLVAARRLWIKAGLHPPQ